MLFTPPSLEEEHENLIEPTLPMNEIMGFNPRPIRNARAEDSAWKLAKACLCSNPSKSDEILNTLTFQATRYVADVMLTEKPDHQGTKDFISGHAIYNQVVMHFLAYGVMPSSFGEATPALVRSWNFAVFAEEEEKLYPIVEKERFIYELKRRIINNEPTVTYWGFLLGKFARRVVN